MFEKKLKIGLVGFGRFGKKYFNILSKMKKITDKNDTKLVLIYFTRPENRFSKKNVIFYFH